MMWPLVSSGGRHDRHSDPVGRNRQADRHLRSPCRHTFGGVRSAGLAAATLVELLTGTGAAIDVSGTALAARAGASGRRATTARWRTWSPTGVRRGAARRVGALTRVGQR